MLLVSFRNQTTHLETEIGGSERADRTNIDRVKRIIIFQPLAGIRAQHRITTAIRQTRVHHRARSPDKTNAARTENAALIIEPNARPEHNVFGFLTLFSRKRDLLVPKSTLNSVTCILPLDRIWDNQVDD